MFFLRKEDYKTYLLYNAKKEHVVPLMALLLKKYDSNITFFNCDDVLESVFYSDGTAALEIDAFGQLLVQALRTTEGFGSCGIENESCPSPDPEKPWLRLKTTIRIPIKR